MRVATVPSGIERTFDEHEIIVTKTDIRGVIQYANDVFLRVSACEEVDVLGRPHNIIRHPSMPRCIFKQLWETIATGQEMFAYILNLALDGAHYWVLAHVTPSFSPGGDIIGYHSNRRVPERSAVDAVVPIYSRLLAEEARHDHAPTAIDASSHMLGGLLDSRGQTYDEFVWDLTNRSAWAC